MTKHTIKVIAQKTHTEKRKYAGQNGEAVVEVVPPVVITTLGMNAVLGEELGHSVSMYPLLSTEEGSYFQVLTRGEKSKNLLATLSSRLQQFVDNPAEWIAMNPEEDPFSTVRNL